MCKYLSILTLILFSLFAAGCGSRSSQYEGKWVRTDSIGSTEVTETLDLGSDARFEQVYLLSEKGKQMGRFAVAGEWKIKRDNLELTYDTIGMRWSGDSEMGAIFMEEFRKSLTRIPENMCYGLSDVRVTGESLAGSQSGIIIAYNRVSNSPKKEE